MVITAGERRLENRDVVEAFWSVPLSVFYRVWRPREALVCNFNEPIVPVEGVFVRLPLSQCGGFLNVRPHRVPYRAGALTTAVRAHGAPGADTGNRRSAESLTPSTHARGIPPVQKPRIMPDLLFNRSFS